MKQTPGTRAGTVALTYVIVAALWILFSDKLLGLLVRNPDTYVLISILKGWVFVAVTGGLLYLTLRRSFDQLAREAEAQQRLEAARRESDSRLREVFECSRDAIGIGKNGRQVFANPAYLKMFGFKDNAQIAGTSVLNHIAPAHRPEVQEDIRRRAAGEGGRAFYETRGLTADGVEFDMEISLSTYQALGDTFTVVTIRDITERKQAAEQMSLHLSALTAAANAILITNRAGRIEWVNPAFTGLTGYSAAEAIGANPRLLKSGHHTPGFYANLWATICTGNVWHGELVNQRKDGRMYTEDTTITPVRGADGEIAHFVAIKQDVTERRLLEAQYRQAQKMEAIGTLAGGIAHDFNNILAAIFGYCHLFEEATADNAPAQEFVREMFQAAHRAKDLVRQILTFSRQGEQNRQFIHLDTVVKEAAKLLRASLPAQITIETHLSADAPGVLADSTQIYQVTMNLATNALHAMEGGPGRLTIRLDSCWPDDDLRRRQPALRAIQYACLTFTDTGCGMDAGTLERIFEPFFTTKPVGKGTGLGLAVVHGIMQSHEGLITVESRPGLGTTFHLYFPAQTPPETPAGPAYEAGSLPCGQGQSILLVDDEPVLAVMFQRLLTGLNYQVTSCHSPRAALDLFRDNPGRFDLVVTDLTMPEMSGLEVARQIHLLRPEAPIVLASGHGGNLAEEDLRSAGIREILQKPVSLPVLAALVHRLLADPAREVGTAPAKPSW